MDLPLHEDDLDAEGVIRASAITPLRPDMPAAAVLCWFPEVVEEVLDAGLYISRVASSKAVDDSLDVCKGHVDGRGQVVKKRLQGQNSKPVNDEGGDLERSAHRCVTGSQRGVLLQANGAEDSRQVGLQIIEKCLYVHLELVGVCIGEAVDDGLDFGNKPVDGLGDVIRECLQSMHMVLVVVDSGEHACGTQARLT